MDAFFVVGPEGSGTNMLEEAFVSAGCFRVSAPSIAKSFEIQKPVVFRRSLPHAWVWPDLKGYTAQMREAGFTVKPIVIFREWNATVKSVMRRDSERKKDRVETNMQQAIKEIGTLIDPIYITYEAFCLEPGFRNWLFVERFGLSEPSIEIKYANPKYYQ